MKKLISSLFFLLTLWLPMQIHAQLTQGDVMIVYFNGDGDGTPAPFPGGVPSANCGDGFGFFNLVEIPDGEELIFTEEEWNVGTNQFDNGDEGHVIWTNSTGDVIPANTFILITTHGQEEVAAGDCGPLESTVGSAGFGGDPTDVWALSSSNEEIYVYQGTAGNPSNWISAFFTDEMAPGTNVPSELTGFLVDLEPADSDADLAYYAGPTSCASQTICVTNITDPTNWIIKNGEGFQHPCDVPTSLSTAAITNTSATISWTGEDPTGNYELWYKPVISGVPYTKVPVQGVTSIDVSDLIAGQPYKFRVRSSCSIYGNVVESPFSELSFFSTTLIGCDVPDGLGTTAIDNTTATIIWNDVNPGQNYNVWYKPLVSGLPYTKVDVTGNASLDLTGLVVGQAYKFMVRSVCDLDGDIVTTSFSELYYFETAVNGCDVPDALSTSGVDNTSATLNWNGDPAGNYEVRFKPLVSGVFPTIYTVSGSLSLPQSGLDPGMSYKFSVRAVCVIDLQTVHSDYSEYFVFTTTSTGCDPPTGIFADPPLAQSATVNWTDSNPGSNYIVQYKPTISGVSWISLPATGSSAVLSGLIPDQRYKYRLISVCDLSGPSLIQSDPSPWFFFTTTSLGTIAIQSERSTMEAEVADVQKSFEQVLTMYPIPVRDYLNIHFNPEEEGKGVVSIISALGREIFQMEFRNRFVEIIDLRGRDKGVYFVRILYNDTSLSNRFVHLGQ